METHRLASFTSEVPLAVPAAAVDLPRWLFEFSDTEYRQCAKGHFGIGASTLPDGRRTSVCVESVGGHLAVQHYLAEVSEPHHLKLVSERSDAWIFHLLHFHPRVTWEMSVTAASQASCTFRCAVAVEHPSIFIKAASVLTLFQYFVERHDREEAKLFAQNLARRSNPGLDVRALPGQAEAVAPERSAR